MSRSRALIPLEIAVSVQDQPLARARSFRFPAGLTCEDIIDRVELSEIARRNVGIMLNDAVIEREHWHLVRPKAFDRHGFPIVVLVMDIPQGGRSSRKVLSTAVTLAFTAAAAAVSFGTLAPAAFGLTAAQTSALAAFGLATVGSVAGRLLAPPPVVAKEREQKDPAIAGISGNPLRPLEYLPYAVGFMRVSPALIAVPWFQSETDRQRAVACYGMAGRYGSSDFLINGTPIENFTLLDTEVQEGLTSDGAMSHDAAKTGVPQAGNELANFVLDPDGGSSNVPLANQDDGDLPQWQYFTTSGPATQWWFDLVWPGGILKTNDGNVAAMAFRVEWKPKGSSPDAWIKGPVFHVKDNKQGGTFLRQTLKFVIASAPTGISGESSDNNVFLIARRTANGKPFVYTADAYFTGDSNGVSNFVEITPDGAIVYLDPGTFDRDIYDVRIMRGLAFEFSKFTYKILDGGYAWNGDQDFANFFEAFDDSGTDKARIGQTKYQSSVSIERFQTLDDDLPAFDFAGKNVWKWALGLYNKTVDSASVFLKSKLPIWNGSNWNTIAQTQNPAAICLGILLGRNGLNADPVTSDDIDWEAFQDWYDYCEAQGLACNIAFAGGNAADTDARTVAASGAAKLYRWPKFYPIIERPRIVGSPPEPEPPVQVLTSLNSRDLEIAKSFDDLPHGLRIEWLDETNDFREGEPRELYAPGYDSGNATRINSPRFEGPTTAAQVDYLGDLMLRALWYRPRLYTTTVFQEWLITRPGDLLGANHNVCDPGHFQAYIADNGVQKSGGNIIGLVLVEPINLAAVLEEANSVDDIPSGDASHTGCVIRLADGTTITAECEQGIDDHHITFPAPFPDPGSDDLKADCIVGFGALGREYRRLILIDVKPQAGGTAVLTLVDEAPEIHFEDAIGAGQGDLLGDDGEPIGAY